MVDVKLHWTSSMYVKAIKNLHSYPFIISVIISRDTGEYKDAVEDIRESQSNFRSQTVHNLFGIYFDTAEHMVESVPCVLNATLLHQDKMGYS